MSVVETPLRAAPTDDGASLAEALRSLASSLEPPGERQRFRGTADDASVAACRRVARELDLQLDVDPDCTTAFDLAEWLEANHVRYRRVSLGPGWWRRDSGPLLGVARRVDGTEPGVDRKSPDDRSSTAANHIAGPKARGPGVADFDAPDFDGADREEPDSGPGEANMADRFVALIRKGRGYERVDPATGRRQAVTRESARELGRSAWILYRQLPVRSLRWTDLLKVAWSGQRQDAIRLVIVGLAAGLLSLALPIATARWVDQGIVPGARSVIHEILLAVVVAALATALFQLLYGFLLLRSKSRLDGSLQAAIWDRLLALPVDFYRRFSIGDMGERAMGLDQVRTLLTRDVTALVLSLAGLLTGWALLFYYSWMMALVATGLGAILVVSMLALTLAQLRHERARQHYRGRASSFVYALLSGIEKLRVGQAETRAFSTWADLFARQRRHDVANRRLANHQAVWTAVYGVLGSIALFTVVWWTAGAGMSLGELLAFHAAYGQFQGALMAILATAPTLLSFVPTYERVQPILQAVPEAAGRRRNPGRLEGEIELRDVSFRYDDGGPWTVDSLSFRLAPGELVALVGPSGSGKSTCLRLLLGFETPSAGQVLYDGQDLGQLDVHLVRRQLGVVLQNHLPTAGDVYHNIAGGRALGLDRAWAAARRVGLAEEIEHLPMGMFTAVNRRGVTFSGGQRQRMLIARAIAREPKILLLDEATSALDNRTQDSITHSLQALGASRLVIAHRLSTIRAADRILVLDQGKLIESGTYESLMRTDGLFRDMARRQQVTPRSIAHRGEARP